jgi:hypothetical protein
MILFSRSWISVLDPDRKKWLASIEVSLSYRALNRLGTYVGQTDANFGIEGR